MGYTDRKSQLNKRFNEGAIIELIEAGEGFTKKRHAYLKKLDKKTLIQVLLSVEYGNTTGFEPVKFEKKSKKVTVQDDED